MKKILVAILLGSVVGCGEGKTGTSVGPSPLPVASAAEGKPVQATLPRTEATGDASVHGTVRIKGKAASPKRIPMGDAKCLELHGGSPPKSEALVVDGENRVKGALVSIKSGLEGKAFAAPKESVLLDQKRCMYVPHVLALMVGQPLKIRNSDPMLHNIHGLPFANREFNFAQQSGEEREVTFKLPEVPIKLKCDVHAWMGAWVNVFDHPFFSVTDDAGAFAINSLPSGKYTIEVWHETYKSVSKDVEVKSGEAKGVDFELVEKKE